MGVVENVHDADLRLHTFEKVRNPSEMLFQHPGLPSEESRIMQTGKFSRADQPTKKNNKKPTKKPQKSESCEKKTIQTAVN